MTPAPPGYITAMEHEPLPVAHGPPEKSLSHEEAEQLAALGELRPGFCERGYRSVRLSRYCGIVGLGGRILEILPKVDERLAPEECRGVLLRLLRHADDLPLFRHSPAGQHLTRAPLLEIFIAAFFEAVTQIVRGGLLHQYREAEEDLSVVRGGIVAARQFAANWNRPDRIACRFDHLTADNRWNRLLKLALHLVRPWVQSAGLYRQWAELWTIFDGVDHMVADPRALDRLVFDRHAARYRGAIEWVRWIVGLLSPSLRAGANAAPALLFDTNALFESAVAALLRRGADREAEIQVRAPGQSLARLAGAGGRQAYGLRPDIVVRRAAGVAAIGDAKWKRLSVGRGGHLFPGEADIYQMHAYAAAFGCRNLALIYPWHRELDSSCETGFQIPRPEGGTVSIDVLCIDVSSDSLPLVRGAGAPEFGPLLKARV